MTEGGAGDPAEGWAVCCSGGGIRSASYCLGALQRLEQEGFLAGQVRLIVGVSGGGYIAASRALVAYGLAKNRLAAEELVAEELAAEELAAEELAAEGPGPASLGPDAEPPPPYAPGTPELEHLRENTRYIAPDAKTLLAGVLSLVLGVAVTLVLALAPLFAAAHAWGWLLRWRRILTYTMAAHSGAPQWTAAVTGFTWWIWPVGAAGVTLVVFLWWWATLKPGPGPKGRERHSQVEVRWLGWAAFVTLMIALATLAVPELVAWLSGSHAGALKTVLDDLGFGAGVAWTPAALAGFVMAVVAVSQSAQMALVKYGLVGAQANAQAANAQPTLTIPAPVATFLRARLMPWLASILIVLAGIVAVLRWVKDGAAAGFTAGQLWMVIGALAVMLAARFLTDVNRISLHDFYRWRLSVAYAVVRKPGQGFGVENSPGTRLSELGGKGDGPPLVLCATANINGERKVPVGRGGYSLTFDRGHATLRGPDPRRPILACTKDYEILVGERRFTLFDVSAISGAAFSPLMGAATQQAHRILFTVTDLRLGVWLPHPRLVEAAAEQEKARNDHWWHALWLLAWYMLPHSRGRRHRDKTEKREARLWAYVLRLRRDKAEFGKLLYQALQPTLGLLYAEAAGHTSYRATWVCVTDGGHYDNLGLVEALKRRTELGFTNLLVLDASGDKANTWNTLGGSIARARSDADTEIALDPTTMTGPLPSGAPALANGQVLCPWASGSFTAQGVSGKIVVCKLGWWTGAPWDVRAYAASHSTFPTDGTLNQLYDNAEFDAYRELGWSAVDRAIRDGKLTRRGPAAPA